MRQRLVRALIFATIGAATATALTFWQNIPDKGTVIAIVAAISFALGLVFKLKAM